MEPRELKPGDVVQINPETVGNKAFTACMLVVEKTMPWGCQGYVQALGESRDSGGGLAYMRLRWDQMEFVGRAVWTCEWNPAPDADSGKGAAPP